MKLPAFTDAIVDHLSDREIPRKPDAAIILGSGLGGFAKNISEARSIPYEEIPGMPRPSVAGHEGRLIFGRINHRSVLAFSGRFHHYEGFSFEQTAIPVYISHVLGAEKLIVSNAAGAINTSLSVGDLMVIESVIRNNMGIAPRGYRPYRYRHHRWVRKIRDIATGIGVETHPGTYMYVTGPNYETKAEIRAFRRMGADAVGMSTACELFEAARLNLKSAAISLITNMSTGITGARLSHREVEAAAGARTEDFAKLVVALIEKF